MSSQLTLSSCIRDDELISKARHLLDRFQVSESEFVQKIEAFLLNEGKQFLSETLFAKFENSLEQEKKRLRSELSSKNALNSPLLSSELKRPLPSPSPTSSKIPNLGPKPPQTSVYKSRKDSSLTIHSFNSNTRPPSGESNSKRGPKCQVSIDSAIFDNILQKYRYMFTPLEERAAILESHQIRMQKELCQFALVDENALVPVGSSSQGIVWVCGRICCDSSEGRINSASVLLEGSKKFSNGNRVQLNLSEIESYSLFPGQIVLVEGICSENRIFNVKRIIDGVIKPRLLTHSTKLREFHTSKQFQSGESLSVFMATGPFTASENLEYEPIQDLFRLILKKKPDIVILTGPFVDVNHPIIESGEVFLDGEESAEHFASFEMIFVEKIIRDCLTRFFNSEETYGRCYTQFILIPSLSDAHHDFVFPQPPFSNKDMIRFSLFDEALGTLTFPFSADPEKRIHLLPNPCMFRINEVLFAVTSNDILYSLTSDECSLNINHKIEYLAKHILKQQSFSPQFPIPVSQSFQVDLRQLKHLQIKSNPDVLVLPSRLTQMVKNIEGTLVINPGSLTKGNSGGTYCEITIQPFTDSQFREFSLENRELLPHDIEHRASVEIIKI